jgi:uncharacterized membrane protein YccC
VCEQSQNGVKWSFPCQPIREVQDKTSDRHTSRKANSHVRREYLREYWKPLVLRVNLSKACIQKRARIKVSRRRQHNSSTTTTTRRQASHEETVNHTAEKQNSIYSGKALNAMIED